MNYAEDRLDRRARFLNDDKESGSGRGGGGDSPSTLWKDYCHALSTKNNKNHELLGRTLRDIGWNRHAVFHYALAWCEAESSSPSPSSSSPLVSEKACGDYAQMAEFAGFPEIGVLAILAWRSNIKLVQPPTSTKDNTGDYKLPHNESWLQQQAPPVGQDCGCGNHNCGKSACYLPIHKDDIETIVNDLKEYHVQAGCGRQVPPLSHILNFHNGKHKTPPLQEPDISPRQAFWKSSSPDDGDGNTASFRKLSPMLQMLLMKLLYECMPQLAAEAVCHASTMIPENKMRQECKSHHAYWVLIKAVVFGERVKDHRKTHHRALWPQLWPQLWPTVATNDDSSNTMLQSETTLPFFDHLNNLAIASYTDTLPPIQWEMPIYMRAEPLFLVGDSHVLSLAWQTIRIAKQTTILKRQIVPVVITGLKAWHMRSETLFFTRKNLEIMMQRLPLTHSSTILFSAGEIDCREGLGGANLQGYESTCLDRVPPTVSAYVNALQDLAQQTGKQILVLPVAPHKHRNTSKKTGQLSRRRTTKAWNQELRSALPLPNVFLLDFAEALRDPNETEYVLNPQYNADGTHMNSGFAPLVSEAIEVCGCDLTRF